MIKYNKFQVYMSTTLEHLLFHGREKIINKIEKNHKKNRCYAYYFISHPCVFKNKIFSL
jgi:hypothetical protein